MASIPGRHDEVKNFVNKFLSLHGAGRKARLNLDCHGGQLWVSLHAELVEQPGQAVPLLPQHGAAPATRQTKPTPTRHRHRKGGRPCREARRARRVLATFLSLPFYLQEADETPMVDPVSTPALHSAETVEAFSNSAEVVDMDTMPAPPHSTPATPLHVSDDEEADARRHACRERDARQSLARSENDCESPDSRPEPAVPSTPIKSSIPKRLVNEGMSTPQWSTPSILKNNMSSLEGQMAYYNFCRTREERKEREQFAEEMHRFQDRRDQLFAAAMNEL